MKLFTSLLLFTYITFGIYGQKSTIYSALKNGSKETLNNELTKINSYPSKLKKGYEGALYCKLANLEKLPANKLNYFKKGASLLEAAIESDKTNVELRFLRLIIQENSPPFLRYKSNIHDDCKLIKENYKSIDIELKNSIYDYAKSSQNLHL